MLHRGAIDKMAPLSSLSIINRYRYFVFMTATAENPFSQKYVVTKENSYLINLDSRFPQAVNLRKFVCIQLVFQDAVTGCSCSQVVSPETLLAANGFLIHSNSEYNENYFCEAHKWLMKGSFLVSVSLLGRCLSEV